MNAGESAENFKNQDKCLEAELASDFTPDGPRRKCHKNSNKVFYNEDVVNIDTPDPKDRIDFNS